MQQRVRSRTRTTGIRQTIQKIGNNKVRNKVSIKTETVAVHRSKSQRWTVHQPPGKLWQDNLTLKRQPGLMSFSGASRLSNSVALQIPVWPNFAGDRRKIEKPISSLPVRIENGCVSEAQHYLGNLTPQWIQSC